MLLPNLNKLCNFTGVATARGNTSKYVAEKYGFKYCTNNAGEILEDSGTNAVFIATRHNLHAKYVIEGLSKGKNIFVESRLLCLSMSLKKLKKSIIHKT
jgi:polar amino acid transport system substrate-binding protein